MEERPGSRHKQQEIKELAPEMATVQVEGQGEVYAVAWEVQASCGSSIQGRVAVDVEISQAPGG